jgi:hypothetical protein
MMMKFNLLCSIILVFTSIAIHNHQPNTIKLPYNTIHTIQNENSKQTLLFQIECLLILILQRLSCK